MNEWKQVNDYEISVDKKAAKCLIKIQAFRFLFGRYSDGNGSIVVKNVDEKCESEKRKKNWLWTADSSSWVMTFISA